MSLNRGGEERPSRRKEGWEVGTEGAGAGGGPPGRGEQQHSRVSDDYFHTKVSMCYCLRCVGTRYKHHIYTGGYNAGLYCYCVRESLKKRGILPLNERSPSRSSSSPPAEAGLVGMVVWITGTTSLPPKRSNKSLAWE